MFSCHLLTYCILQVESEHLYDPTGGLPLGPVAFSKLFLCFFLEMGADSLLYVIFLWETWLAEYVVLDVVVAFESFPGVFA